MFQKDAIKVINNNDQSFEKFIILENFLLLINFKEVISSTVTVFYFLFNSLS